VDVGVDRPGRGVETGGKATVAGVGAAAEDEARARVSRHAHGVEEVGAAALIALGLNPGSGIPFGIDAREAVLVAGNREAGPAVVERLARGDAVAVALDQEAAGGVAGRLRTEERAGVERAAVPF